MFHVRLHAHSVCVYIYIHICTCYIYHSILYHTILYCIIFIQIYTHRLHPTRKTTVLVFPVFSASEAQDNPFASHAPHRVTDDHGTTMPHGRAKPLYFASVTVSFQDEGTRFSGRGNPSKLSKSHLAQVEEM